jgi:hypothetical protein
MDYREGMQILRAAGLHAPAIVQLDGYYHVFSRTQLISGGASIEDALDAGGFLVAENAPRLIFVAVDYNVMIGDDNQAVARTKTMAQRIANALNEYIPGDRDF